MDATVACVVFFDRAFVFLYTYAVVCEMGWSVGGVGRLYGDVGVGMDVMMRFKS